jgi:hypothetical protein
VRLLVLSAQAVHEVLPYGECAELVRDGLAALARGQVYQLLRTVIRPPAAEALMVVMPCVRPAGSWPLTGIRIARRAPDRGRRAAAELGVGTWVDF